MGGFPKTEGFAIRVISDPRKEAADSVTEVDSEDDSDCDSGPESFVFNPLESDDDLDSVIDALERDLEDGGASVLQPAAEDVQEVAPEVDMQDIPVVGTRPRSRSIEHRIS